MKKNKRTRKQLVGLSAAERGQGLLEFAFIFPLLIILIFGIMELGFYFMTYQTVQNASREAAREASVMEDLEVNDDRVEDYVEALLPIAGPFVGFNGGVTNTNVDDCESSTLFTVTVAGEYNFIALNVLGINGVDLSFPSTTHYELCGAYTGGAGAPGATATVTPGPSATAGPSDTPTPTITPTPSNTPTPTNTLVASNTPTASPTPECSIVGGSLQYDGDDVRWNVTNNGGSTDRLSAVYFDWIDWPYYNYFDHLNFGGDRIHNGNDSSPTTYISGGWSGSGSDRDLAPSQTKQLNIDFAYNHLWWGVAVYVQFESGCDAYVGF